MRKLWFPLAMALTLSGCASQQKGGDLSVVYGVLAGLSLLVLVGYCVLEKKKELWYLLLVAAVTVVNIGYLLLATSQNLEQALMANRVAYLGSVFLPLSMLMIILNVTRIRHPKWLQWALLGLGAMVLFVAASPGWLDIYYRSVGFELVNGAGRLIKEYGVWHNLYVVYLLGYFGAMVSVIVYSELKGKLQTRMHAVILAAAVFVNIGVWLFGQFVEMEFEILSVSYIITELFLLALHRLMAEHQKLKEKLKSVSEKTVVPADPEQLQQYAQGLLTLTQTEKTVLSHYVNGKSTRQVLEEMGIKENTLKFHNKNLYSKLGVNSRKQLVDRYQQLPK